MEDEFTLGSMDGMEDGFSLCLMDGMEDEFSLCLMDGMKDEFSLGTLNSMDDVFQEGPKLGVVDGFCRACPSPRDVLSLVDTISSTEEEEEEEEEVSLEGLDIEDGDGMLLQTGIDGRTFIGTTACSKQL